MTLKPTIINGQWVYLPAPIQDLPWLKRQPPLALGACIKETNK
jgi:hypothetical protein